jgi:hypothetical protein
MFEKITISLAIPEPVATRPYFSLRLKENVGDELSEYHYPGQIFVVSDIGSNFPYFCQLLLQRKIIDRKFQWAFGKSHLMVLGNCFDQAAEATELLWFIYSLEERARREGGHVHFLLGSQELHHMNGDWRYKHPRYAVKKETSQTPATALYDGNHELWRWLRTRNIIEKIGPYLFVHGGLSPIVNELNYTIPEINELARRYYLQANEEIADPQLALLFSMENGPLGYKGYYDGTATEQQVNAVLEKFGVTTIITGHTLAHDTCPHFDGKVINVNTAGSTEKSGGLLIREDRFYCINTDKIKTRIK